MFLPTAHPFNEYPAKSAVVRANESNVEVPPVQQSSESSLPSRLPDATSYGAMGNARTRSASGLYFDKLLIVARMAVLLPCPIPQNSVRRHFRTNTWPRVILQEHALGCILLVAVGGLGRRRFLR